MAVVLMFCAISPAQAYLDPGTGSIILQGAIAAVAAGLATGKLWWHRVKDLFSKSPQDEENDADNESNRD